MSEEKDWRRRCSGGGTKNEGRKGNARVFVLNTKKAAEMPEVITVKLDKSLVVETGDGNQVRISEVLKKGKVLLAGHVIPVQLLPMTLAGFDIVLGMDWLSDNQARILCDKKAIEIRANGKTIQIPGDKDGGHVSLISMIKANKYLRKGCLAFMVYVTEEPKEKKLEDVPIVSEFPDVFPEELPGIPPEGDVEFRIDT
ncbi:uncharacterized protein LOC143631121 [Bidens hawaiensis]|uniref:uncharacterized protein LOC143631121 n=1 Tax=Bidens hawaiensis TaxID=980011 RepID=UPI00404A7690